MAEIKKNGYTQDQLDALRDTTTYRTTLETLEESEGYISSTELAEMTGQYKADITMFLGVLRTKKYITGTVENGEYLWNSKPEKFEWHNIQETLDKRPKQL